MIWRKKGHSNWFESQPPNPGFIIYCRIVTGDITATDGLWPLHQNLQKIFRSILDSQQKSVYSSHSSVYGRFCCIKDARQAIEIAKEILTESHKKGVSLAIGVACLGRLEIVDDFGAKNLLGNPINIAARLAAITDSEGKIFVTQEVVKLLELGPEPFKSEAKIAKVKKTDLLYWVLNHQAKGPFGSPGLDRDSRKLINVYVVVYDIVDYSLMTIEAAQGAVTILQSIAAEQFKKPHGVCHAVRKSIGVHYSPAGDGGVLVFGAGHLDDAWKFAQALIRESRGKVRIRVGIANGLAQFIDGGDSIELPIGSAILEADRLSGIPPTGRICVGEVFWEGCNEDDKKEWEEILSSSVDGSVSLVLRDTKNKLEFCGKQFTSLYPDARKYIEKINTIFALQSSYAQKRLLSFVPEVFLQDLVSMYGLKPLLEIVLENLKNENQSYASNRDSPNRNLLLDFLEVIAPFGVAPEFIAEERVSLVPGNIKMVQLPIGFGPVSIEIVSSALDDRQCHFDKDHIIANFEDPNSVFNYAKIQIKERFIEANPKYEATNPNIGNRSQVRNGFDEDPLAFHRKPCSYVGSTFKFID